MPLPPFPSKFAGTCAGCAEPFPAGTMIRWYGAGRGKPGRPYHADCNRRAVDLDHEPGLEPEHPAESDREPSAGPEAEADLVGALARALQGRIAAPAPAIDEEAVRRIVDDAIAGLTMPTTVEIRNADTGLAVNVGLAHHMLPTVAKVLGTRRDGHPLIPYLYGPSGSGKSYVARQLADGLGVPFSFETLCPMDVPSKLYGFRDGFGNLHRTKFRDAFEHGGVILLDELDNSSPLLQTTLNDALANGECPFPDGLVKRHHDCYVIAAGNTAGRGANPLYPGRQPFDAAFATRFVYLKFDYDETLERSAALQVNPDAGAWVDFVQHARAYCAANSVPLLVTPRASLDGAALLGSLSTAELADACIFKGCDPTWRDRVMADAGGAR